MAYKGTRYHGWQKQPQVRSVQELIESAISHVLGKAIIIHGCGRTDKGVHAQQFFAHFNYDLPIEFNLVFRLNKMLPPDIRVFTFFEVPFKANAQYDATSRTYTYYIHSYEDPFISDLSAYYNVTNFDKKLLNAAINYIPVIQDFRSVCLKPNQYKTTNCKITQASISYQSEKKLTIQITANRFLQGMMRLLIGRVIEVASGRLPIERYQEILREKGTFPHIWKAYPQGLHLTEVTYPFVKPTSPESIFSRN